MTTGPRFLYADTLNVQDVEDGLVVTMSFAEAARAISWSNQNRRFNTEALRRLLAAPTQGPGRERSLGIARMPVPSEPVMLRWVAHLHEMLNRAIKGLAEEGESWWPRQSALARLLRSACAPALEASDAETQFDVLFTVLAWLHAQNLRAGHVVRGIESLPPKDAEAIKYSLGRCVNLSPNVSLNPIHTTFTSLQMTTPADVLGIENM